MKSVNRLITVVSMIAAVTIAFVVAKNMTADHPELQPDTLLKTAAEPLIKAHTGIPVEVSSPAIDNGFAPQGQGTVDGVKALEDKDIQKLAKAIAAELARNGFVANELKRDPKIVAEALVLWGRQNQGPAPEIKEGEIASDILVKAMDPKTAVVVGAPDAVFTAVEFLDHNCPHCRISIPDALAWVDQNPGVRILFRELPVISQQSQDAAKVALALGQQGLYRNWLEQVAAWKGGLIDGAIARQIAKDLGADMTRLEASAGSPEIAKAIADNLELGALLSIDGTPARVIGNKLLIGSASTLWLTDYAAQNGAPLRAGAAPETQGEDATPAATPIETAP